mmetsp:Transcript_12571/g.35837  ORF Transcript_12571/g.35837 Transcript_12571/m.35837 type:complete len:236 (-) Transcript_12571:2070-2777(-)
MTLLVSRSQHFTFLSKAQLNMYGERSEILRPVMDSKCPVRVKRSWPDARSQIRMVRSLDPDAKNSLLGSNARHRTQPWWPLTTRYNSICWCQSGRGHFDAARLAIVALGTYSFSPPVAVGTINVLASACLALAVTRSLEATTSCPVAPSGTTSSRLKRPAFPSTSASTSTADFDESIFCMVGGLESFPSVGTNDSRLSYASEILLLIFSRSARSSSYPMCPKQPAGNNSNFPQDD